MKKVSKKLISVVLAVLMVATMLPLSGIAAFAKTTTSWTVAASTDFTKSTWSSTGSNVKNVGNPLSTGGYVATTSDGGSKMIWSGYEWSNTYMNTDSNGVNLADGVVYLSGSEGGSVPIAGAEAFKLDIAFSFTGDFSVTTRNSGEGPIFLKLATNGNMSFDKGDPWSNTFFTQEGYGRTHNQLATDINSSAEGGNYRISTDTLAKNSEYHYILTYENGYLSAVIKNVTGKNVIKYPAYKGTFDTSAIKGIYIGSANGYYYKNTAIKSVVMSTGTTSVTGERTYVDKDKDKYVFTYFTGNDEAGETLHMAVSDDGLNWEALNGNEPIWNSSKLTGNETSYPDSAGIAASGHVRDPYAFQAQDGTYYVLATDLNTKGGTAWGNNTKMMVWHLNSLADLATTNPWYIDTQSIMADAGLTSSVSRAWAPEAIWDEEAGHYMLFWSCGYVNGHTLMYYAYTDDFKTLLTTPEQLITTGVDNIDGDITFDGVKYYLWFKDETNKRIAVSTSDHANGPYSTPTEFYDEQVPSLEGPEVYQLQNGNYVLIADYYNNDTSYFAMYQTAETPDTMSTESKVNNKRLNHLSPRHGSVMNITTEEYNKLVAAYGKSTFDITGVEANKTANDYLVARYFTSDDATYDATGNGNTLTTSNVTMTNDYNGKAAAHFSGTAEDATKTNSASTKADSYSKNGSYASINTSEMFKNVDASTGVTFSWYGYADNANEGRWLDWTTVSDAGQVSWDNELGTGQSQTNNAYIYSAANMEFGANNHGTTAIADGYKGTSYKGAWHEYTMSVSHGYICFWVDGALFYTNYSGGKVSKQGTPIALSSMNKDFFNETKNATLYMGISSYAADRMLNGYISDFKVYNRALSAKDIEDSQKALDSEIPTTDVETNATQYYDPMEAGTFDGVEKTAYAASVTDPSDLHGTVLNINGGVDSNYTYSGSATDSSKGYTLSMWYNPGADVTQETVFQIGRKNSVDGSNRRYFELQEDGHLWFNYEVDGTSSYVDATGVFGDEGLTVNEWAHITIQIKPNGNSDIIYVYVDGKLRSTTNLFTTSFGHNNVSGRAPHDFFALDHNVYYGSSCGYWNGASQDAYLDDFTIYSGLYSATSIFNNDADMIADTLIRKAMEEYKAKMALLDKKDYVYTNMSAAYEAYDRASRYIDSVKFGTSTAKPSEVLELYRNLTNAVDNMQIYSKPVTKNGLSTSETGVANAVSAQYTNNMLSTVDLSPTTEIEGGTEQYHFSAALSSTSFTWLYTGLENDTPTAPLTLAVRKTNQSLGSSQRLESVHFKDDTSNPTTQSDLVIPEKWKMSNTSGDVQNWVYEQSGLTDVANHHVTSQKNSDGYFGFYDNKTWFQGSGYITYNGTLTTSDPYYISITPTFVCDNSWQVTGSGLRPDLPFKPTGEITIINFTHVREVLCDQKLSYYLCNITDYTPSSTKELLAAFDDLTSLDYDVNGVAAAKSLSEVAEEKVNYLLGVDLSKIENKANGDSLYEESQKQTPFVDGALGTKDETGAITAGNIDSNGNYVPTLDENGKEMKYTTSSWKAYEQAYEKLIQYFTDLNPYATNNQYATSQSQLDEIENNVKKAKTALQVAADYSNVDSAVADSQVYTDRVHRNYNSAGQIYTYDSYIDFSVAHDNADVWANKTAAYRADTERYNIKYVTEFDQNGVHYSNGPYIAYDANDNVVTSDDQAIDHYTFVGVFYDNEGDANPSQFQTGDYVLIDGNYIKLNGHRYYTDLSAITDSEGNYVYSNRQNAIIDTAADLLDKDGKLTGVDAASAYEAFDSTLTVVDAIDTAKYTQAGLEYLQNAVDAADSAVYATLTGDALTAYNKATKKSFAEGTRIKRTAYSLTDPQTSSVLTAINYINDAANKETYINKFHATLDVQIAGESQGTVDIPDAYYGEEFTLSGAGLVADKNVSVSKWSVSILDDDNKTVKSSQKISGVAGDTLTRIADSNIAVVVNYDYSDNTTTGYKYDIYDVYNNRTAVMYSENLYDATTVADGLGISAKKIPFYSFAQWDVIKVEGENTYKVRPIYTLDKTYTITTDGNVTGVLADNEDGTYTARYDGTVTISTNDADFYAWAVKSDVNDKYTIASYNSTYSFFVACDEEYVQVKKTASGYTIGGDAVSSANIDCALANDISDNITVDDYITQKLDSKAPFTSVEFVTMTSTQARAYVRITTGCSVNVASYGVIYSPSVANADTMVKNGTGVYTRAVNNANAYGQYCYTLNSKSSFTTANFTFRAYVNYDFTYKFTHTTGSADYDNQADINALEYSNVRIATTA